MMNNGRGRPGGGFVRPATRLRSADRLRPLSAKRVPKHWKTELDNDEKDDRLSGFPQIGDVLGQLTMDTD